MGEGATAAFDYRMLIIPSITAAVSIIGIIFNFLIAKSSYAKLLENFKEQEKFNAVSAFYNPLLILLHKLIAAGVSNFDFSAYQAGGPGSHPTADINAYNKLKEEWSGFIEWINNNKNIRFFNDSLSADFFALIKYAYAFVCFDADSPHPARPNLPNLTSMIAAVEKEITAAE